MSDLQVNKELSDSGLAQIMNLAFSTFETDNFILPDLENQNTTPREMQIKTEPKEDLLTTEYVLGFSAGDELTPAPTAELDRDLSSELDRKDCTITYSQVHLDEQQMISRQEQVGIKVPFASTQGTSEEKIKSGDQDHSGLLESDTCLISPQRENVSSQQSNKRFKSCCEIETRISKVKPLTLVQTCLHCKKIFQSLEELRKHHLSHERVRIVSKCVQCSETFSDFLILQNHMKMHVLDKQNSVGVPESDRLSVNDNLVLDRINCDTEFGSISSLLDQQMECSAEDAPKNVPYVDSIFSEAQIELNVNGEDKNFSCNQCDEVFSDKATQILHVKSHIGLSEVCRDFEKSFHPQNHLNGHTFENSGETNLTCDYCGKAFMKKSHFKEHLLIHTGEKPHVCTQCGKTFRLKSSLKNHNMFHSGEKPYSCSHCGKAFRQKGKLNDHVMLHTGKKPHKCNQCGKAFSQKGNLRMHVISHTVEKSHKCSVCSKAFKHKCSLNAHMLLHSAEKPHLCTQCERVFKNARDLNNHILTHSGEKPHKCSQCGKAYTQKSHLTIHIMSHTGERTHKCCQCNKAFMHKSNLNKHMLLHSGEKPHKCSQCGRAFTQKAHLKGHILSHIKKNSQMLAMESGKVS